MEFLSGQLNYKIDAYCTWKQTLPPYLDPNSGAPIDVSNYTWLSQIRQDKTQPTALATITVSPTDPTNGVVQLALTATQTGALWKAASALYNTAPTSGYLFLYFDVVGTTSGGLGDTLKLWSGTVQLVGTASHS